MAVTYDVILEGRMVLEYWSGKVTRDDVVEHERRHLADPRIILGASVLIDANEAYFGIAEKEVREIMDSLYGSFPRPLRIKKCALLVNSQTYPLAQAYEKEGITYGISAIAFSNLAIACTWLGLDAKIVESHLERIKKIQAALPQDI